jgi:3-hydroxyacyl-CoA dehydrogenase
VNIQALIMVVVLGGGMIGAGFFLVNGQINSRVAAETAAVAERTRAQLAEQQVERIERDLVKERDRQAALQTELQAARDVEIAATDVLEDRARLDRLTEAKPGLIERLARRATTKVWKEIEAESRE